MTRRDERPQHHVRAVDGGPAGRRSNCEHLPHGPLPPLLRQVHLQQRGELLDPHGQLRGRRLRLHRLHVRVLRVGGARAQREARDQRLLGAAARGGGGGGAARARLHQPRVLPEAARALALPARVRPLGGVDGLLRAGRRARGARRARQARERRRDAPGQDRIHYRDHQPPRVRAQDAEPLRRRSDLRHVLRRHTALPVQGPLQPRRRTLLVRRQHGPQAISRHARLVIEL